MLPSLPLFPWLMGSVPWNIVDHVQPTGGSPSLALGLFLCRSEALPPHTQKSPLPRRSGGANLASEKHLLLLQMAKCLGI